MAFASKASAQGLTILTASDISTLLATLDPELVLDSQRNAFLALNTQSDIPSGGIPPVQCPQRIVLKSGQTNNLFMPSRVADAGGTACKIVSVPMNGGEGGLPATTVVMDESTGKVKAVINARRLTALRNAAGSALFLRAIPPIPPPTNLLIFGSGAQAKAHATIFLGLFPSFTSCTIVVRRSSPRTTALVAELETAFPKISLILGVSNFPNSKSVNSSEASSNAFNLSQTVHNADVILTLTPSTTPLFNSVDVTSGTHLVLVGSYTPSMREVDENLIRRAGLVVVDTKHGCAQEAGDLIAAGLGEERMVELKDVLAHPSWTETIKSEGDVVVFKSVGLGIQDVAIADLVMREAEKLGLGTIVPDYDD